MILVTRINGVDKFYVNEDKIEFLEATPDTVITLDSGKKFVVMETIDEVIGRMVEYKAKLFRFRNQTSGDIIPGPGKE
ncbi:MAG: flagellar FlbD family protein [Oscillospiraceae bacterium]|nr:flagellar FlbD family protein [Oscillospiraceae bacterium]